MTRGMHLRTLIVITNTDGALASDAVRPEAANIDLNVLHAGMREEEPGTEDWLGKDVEDSIGDDFLVDIHVAGAVGDTPDARSLVSNMTRMLPG